ncbi:ABC transporter substrate-binding protein [Saccharomonospora sp. NPDC046836]|uniref:ABC transporter substrate-binding protein n=1 Tax=Saccharomonospora sp. NPDC046836 TaxID=3156921 RepID=UPI0033F0266D
MRAARALRSAAAVVVAVILSACGGGAAPGGSATGTLHISVATAPNSFQVGAWAGGDAVTYLSLYDTIFLRDAEGELQPAIADAWEYSEDRTQLTLEIRPGMTFSDGSPVDAAAVAASLEFARSGPATASNLDSVSSVEAVGDDQVVISLSAPDASLEPALAGVVGVVGAPGSLDSEESKLSPVASGAYVLDEAATTAGSVYVLKKNPDHWNADAYPFDTVEVRVIPDPAAVQNAILSGQLDFGAITPDAEAQFSPAKFTTGTFAPIGLGAIWIADREGTVVPALADARVRQAISLAFDREQIGANLDPGRNNPTNQVFNPNGDVFDEAPLASSYDPERARELMAEAGYAAGFDVTMPSSVITTQYEAAISSALGDIGINVTWEAVPVQNYYAQILAKNYGMFMGIYGFTGSDPQDVKRMTSGIFNPFRLSSPEFQDLMHAVGAVPVEEQPSALQTVNQYFLDQVWIAPFTFVTGKYAASNAIEYTSLTGTANGVRPFAPAGD